VGVNNNIGSVDRVVRQASAGCWRLSASRRSLESWTWAASSPLSRRPAGPRTRGDRAGPRLSAVPARRRRHVRVAVAMERFQNTGQPDWDWWGSCGRRRVRHCGAGRRVGRLARAEVGCGRVGTSRSPPLASRIPRRCTPSTSTSRCWTNSPTSPSNSASRTSSRSTATPGH